MFVSSFHWLGASLQETFPPSLLLMSEPPIDLRVFAHGRGQKPILSPPGRQSFTDERICRGSERGRDRERERGSSERIAIISRARFQEDASGLYGRRAGEGGREGGREGTETCDHR